MIDLMLFYTITCSFNARFVYFIRSILNTRLFYLSNFSPLEDSVLK